MWAAGRADKAGHWLAIVNVALDGRSRVGPAHPPHHSGGVRRWLRRYLHLRLLQRTSRPSRPPWEGGYGADPGVSLAEFGAGERMMDTARINIYRLQRKFASDPR